MRHRLFMMMCSSLLAWMAAYSAEPKTPTPSEAFRRAFANQNARAQSGKTDPTPFITDLRVIAPTGDVVAQFMLAMLTMNDNRAAAMALLHTSAAGGCNGAAGVLGTALADSNPAEAKKLIFAAANGGDTGAQLFLSAAYKNGALGLPRDVVEAFAWATVAQNNAPTVSMRQVATSTVGAIVTQTDPHVLTSGQPRVLSLMSSVPKRAFYLCGYSLP